MAIVALAGDATTTTAIALAATWPAADPNHGPASAPVPVIVEADPTGGSLAAWLDTADTPSLSTVVAALHADADRSMLRGARSTIDPLVQRSGSGIRFIPAPFLASEARGVVEQAGAILFPTLAADDGVVLADLGRVDLDRPPDALRCSRLVLLCHRQDAASPAAATVRLERLAESVSACSTMPSVDVDVVLIGDTPFGSDEVGPFVGVGERCHRLAVDPLAAAVLAGRRGVSARRLARLPLMRSAAVVSSSVAQRTAVSDSSRPGASPAGVVGESAT